MLREVDERREPSSEPFVDLPAPTAWPMIAAFGITLGFAAAEIR